MKNQIMKFNEFVNEELNFTRDSNGIITLENHWFYYNIEDDIIYGSKEIPMNNKDILFSFNPSTCTFIMNNKEKKYDINNPVCLIAYNLNNGELKLYNDNIVEYLHKEGWKGNDIDNMSQPCRISLEDFFEMNYDMRYLILYGNQIVASSFDIIDEN